MLSVPVFTGRCVNNVRTFDLFKYNHLYIVQGKSIVSHVYCHTSNSWRQQYSSQAQYAHDNRGTTWEDDTILEIFYMHI